MFDKDKLSDKDIEKFLEGKSSKELLNFLTENQTVIRSLEHAYHFDYNEENMIPIEHWNFFINALSKLIHSEEFQTKCKEINCKLYALKQFSKVKLSIASSAEETLKFELKKYFPSLYTENGQEFSDTFFNLPFEFTALVVRYLANIKFSKEKKSLTPLLKTAESYFHELVKTKNKFLLNINDISQGKSETLNIVELQTLLDTRAFYEYNPLNVGALEFVMRILVNKKSKQKLEDEFGKTKVELLRQQVLSQPSYIQFLNEIKDNQVEPYFNKQGLQNKNRENTFDELCMQYFFPERYIPDNSNENKQGESESQPPQPEAPAQETPQAEQPSQQELLNPPAES